MTESVKLNFTTDTHEKPICFVFSNKKEHWEKNNVVLMSIQVQHDCVSFSSDFMFFKRLPTSC